MDSVNILITVAIVSLGISLVLLGICLNLAKKVALLLPHDSSITPEILAAITAAIIASRGPQSSEFRISSISVSESNSWARSVRPGFETGKRINR